MSINSRTGAKVITGGKKSIQLKKMIDAKLGVSDTFVWYERPGKVFEMMGQEGGWFYESESACESDPIGLNFEEAVDYVKYIESTTYE